MIDLPHDLASDGYQGAADRDRQQIRMNRAAIAFAAAIAAEFAMPEEAFSQIGKVNAAATVKGAAHLDAYARHLERLGEPFEKRDEASMRALTGTSYYQAGLYTPGAAMVQPALFIRSLAEGLAGLGLQIHEASPVVALERVGADWRASTPGGSITSPAVILAVNGHAESFGFFERRLMHVFTYASMTRPFAEDELKRLGGERRWGVLPADPMGSTVRRIAGTGGDRIVVRNRFTFDPSMEVSERQLERVARDHDKSFRARFPMLGDVEMAYRWGGRLCLSRNAVPVFGEVEPNLFAACCQNGLGTTKGTLAGLLAAELVTGTDNPLLADMLAFAAPQRLPPKPLAWLGATATLRWKERRAGREL
jgi:glycine/D-amino acid oxidase-like deaminating enzyme